VSGQAEPEEFWSAWPWMWRLDCFKILVQFNSGVGNLRHACQAWHVERFSMACWVNWNTVIMIS